jgi:hypothetical protein
VIGGRADADLANAPGTHPVGVRVAFVEPDRVEIADIGIGGDVVGPTGGNISVGPYSSTAPPVM